MPHDMKGNPMNTLPDFSFGDSDTFTHEGVLFNARLVPDEHMGAPWDEHDGHGDVSEWTRRDKAPGELVLSQDRDSYRYYDFAAACVTARRDGWGFLPWPLVTEQDAGGTWTAKAGPFESQSMDVNVAIRAVYAAHRATMTPRQYAAGAARADYERLRAWCDDRWQWVGVVVTRADGLGDDTESLWGIESDSGDYLGEIAAELAAELVAHDD